MSALEAAGVPPVPSASGDDSLGAVVEEAPDPLRVVSGDATPEEVAALVTALAAAASSRAAAAPPPPLSRWSDRASHLNLPPTPGPGAWVASAWRR